MDQKLETMIKKDDWVLYPKTAEDIEDPREIGQVIRVRQAQVDVQTGNNTVSIPKASAYLKVVNFHEPVPESINDLKLHQSMEIGPWLRVYKVPGGLLYEAWNKNAGRVSGQMTFVPYDQPKVGEDTTNEAEEFLWTVDEFNKVQHGEVFAHGYTYDREGECFMHGTGTKLHYVAVKGDDHDWAIYVGTPERDIIEITKTGIRLNDKRNIEACISVTEELLSYYRN